VLTGPQRRRGAAGGRAQGTWVQFDIAVTTATPAPRVAEVRYLALACPHVIAVADWIAEIAVGRAVEPDLPETVAALRARFAVPAEKLGRLLIVEDAWRAAISSPS
jgi:hypothetical protein